MISPLSRRSFLKAGLLYLPVAVHGQEFMPNRRKAFQVSGASSFNYYSATFDGTNDYLTRGAQLTGVTDSKVGLISFWYKPTGGSGTTRYIAHIVNDYFHVRHGNDNTIWPARGFDSSGNSAIDLLGNTAVTSGWHHILSSWDGLNGYKLFYLDGSNDLRGSSAVANFATDFTRNNFAVGATTGGGSKITGLLCEFWFNTEYLDISVQSNREKFRSAGGKPVDLGANGSTPTGTQPVVYLRNAVPNWETNLGSGGGLTENGTLDDGGADIP